MSRRIFFSVIQKKVVSPNDFPMVKSLSLFLVASFGGITTIVGALFGGAFLALLPELQKHVSIDGVQNLGIAIGAIALADNPHGFGGNISMAGQQIREAIAKVRRMPSTPVQREPDVDLTTYETREEVGVG